MTKDKGKEVEFEDTLQCVLDLGNDDVEDEEDGKSIDGRQNRATVEGDYSKDKHNDDDNDADIEEEGDDDDNDSDNEVELQQEFPMELIEGYSLGIQPRQLFEYRDYEQRYGRKRKAVSDGNSEGLGKMASLENFTGASRDEIMEALSYGTQRKSRKLRHLKKCGRRKGSKAKLSPEITRMLGEATVHHVHGRHQEAIAILNEVVRQAPHVSDSYHTLAMAHSSLGNTKKALAFYTIAARLKPKDSSLWKVLFTMHMEEGDIARAKMCMAKAVAADPNDETLRSYEVLLNIKLEKYEEAAASCEHIYRISPEKVDALIAASELYLKCGDLARSVKLLEEHLKDHLAEADSSVILQMVTIFMEAKEYSRALQTVEDFHKLHYPGKEIPVLLKIKAGICHVQLGNISNGENLFSVLQHENTSDHVELIVEVADAFMSVKYFHAALKYYHMVDFEFDNDGSLLLKIAHCYLYLEERVKAIEFFYKALCKRKGSANIRLALASLLLEDKREDEVIPLLSPPENPDVADPKPDKKPWWVDGKIKLKLSLIYRNKGMLEEFANTILPLARESMYLKTFKQKVKRRRLTTSVLRERIKILDVKDAGDIFGGVRPLASKLDLMKANRARKLLQKKEEERALAKAAGIDWQSDDSDDEPLKENSRDPPLPNFLEYEEDYDLIIDLCKALQSLERYWEALEIINLTRRLANNKLAAEKDEELQSLASQISCKTTDPKYSFDYVRSNVLQYPHSIAAWNYYYKITSRLGKSYNRHAKFLRYMKVKHKDCVPPVLIAGHQFTMGSFHQDATREYLEAYKLSPESRLVNLCVGTSLINLALGFRLQNKHQCVVQAMAFLYNNLRLSENSQEALYNIARAYHHIGLVSLAVMYYEKALEIYEKDYPIPKLLNEHSDSEKVTQSGYCDLRREAAYNLHLIYKRSGAVDLARQVLKDHCTL